MRAARRSSAALVAVLLPYLAACAFVHPVADDLTFAAAARSGFWSAWAAQYQSWNGRYASNAVALLDPSRLGRFGYQFVAAAAIVLTVLALYLFLRSLFRRALHPAETVQWTLVVALLYFSRMPSVGEGIYWYTGAAVYQAGIMAALVAFALVISATRPDTRTGGRQWSVGAAAGFLFAAVGFNEVLALLLPSACGGVALALPSGSRARRVWLAMSAIAAAGALALVLSPGNVGRESVYAGRHQLVMSLSMTGLQATRFLADWMTAGPLLLASVLFVPAAQRLTFADTALEVPAATAVRRQRRIIAAALVLIVPAAVFPAYWATGMLGQHRTVNVALFAFLLLWTLGLWTWAADDRPGVRAIGETAQAFRRPLTVLLIVALSATGNSFTLGRELISGDLRKFDHQMRARAAALDDCRRAGQSRCLIPAIERPPRSFHVADITSDPRDWVNAAYAQYYGVPEVGLLRGATGGTRP